MHAEVNTTPNIEALKNTIMAMLLSGKTEQILTHFCVEGASFSVVKGVFINNSAFFMTGHDEDTKEKLWTLVLNGTKYILTRNQNPLKIISRTDDSVTIKTDDLEKMYPGVNSHSLLVDESNWPTGKKLASLESGFVLLFWCLPVLKSECYFYDAIKSEDFPFRKLLFNFKHEVLNSINYIDDIYIKLEDAPKILAEIEDIYKYKKVA